MPRIVCRCIDVIFFRPKGHSVRNEYFVLLNMASVYHIIAIRVNETSWAHVWRLRFHYLRTGYDTSNVQKLQVLARLLSLLELSWFLTRFKSRGARGCEEQWCP
jgi:hypothetical protein